MPHADPEEGRRYNDAWKVANRAKVKVYNRRTYERHKPKILARNRRAFLKRQYGITEDQYLEMLAKQDGKCGVCIKPQKSGRWLAVDHDHDTGKVRGLLCQGCNAKVEKFLRYAQRHLEIHT